MKLHLIPKLLGTPLCFLFRKVVLSCFKKYGKHLNVLDSLHYSQFLVGT